MKIYVRSLVVTAPSIYAATTHKPRWDQPGRRYRTAIMEQQEWATVGGNVLRALINAAEMPTKPNQYLEWDTETQSGYLYTYVLPKTNKTKGA